MIFDFIPLFLGIAVLSCVSCRNTAIALIKEIGISPRYYPKCYVVPKRWVRNLFAIEQHKVPRYLYFELLISIFFLILGPFNITLCIIVDCSKFVAGILLVGHACLIIANLVFLSIMSWLFKRKH